MDRVVVVSTPPPSAAPRPTTHASKHHQPAAIHYLQTTAPPRCPGSGLPPVPRHRSQPGALRTAQHAHTTTTQPSGAPRLPSSTTPTFAPPPPAVPPPYHPPPAAPPRLGHRLTTRRPPPTPTTPRPRQHTPPRVPPPAATKRNPLIRPRTRQRRSPPLTHTCPSHSRPGSSSAQLGAIPPAPRAAATTFMAEGAAAEARRASSRHPSKVALQAKGPPPTRPEQHQGPPAAPSPPYQPSMSAHIQQMPRYRRQRESQPNPEAETVRAYPRVHIRPRPRSPRTPTAQDYEASTRAATATSPHDPITPTDAHSSAQGHGPAQGQWPQRWTHTQLWELRKWVWAEPSLEGLVLPPRKGSVENCRLQPAGGVDAAGRVGSHAGRCAPPKASPPLQPPRAPGPPVCPQEPTGDPPGDATTRAHTPPCHTASVDAPTLAAPAAPQEPRAPHSTTRLTSRPAAPPPNPATQQATTAGRHAGPRPEGTKQTRSRWTSTPTPMGTATPNSDEPKPAAVETT